jgi:cytochrome c biogenesis protein CcdA
MGNSLAGKLIYYWIFVLGGISISYVMKLATDGMDFVILLIALTLVFWGLEFIKFRKKQKQGFETAKTGKGRSQSGKRR